MSRAVKIILICVLLALLLGLFITSSKPPSRSSKLIIFHAGSLAVPFKQICDQFNRLHPELQIEREAAGSRMCARKITDLHRPCDVMASADYTVIDTLLIPEHADWNIKFATNEMVIACQANSANAKRITKNNWPDILLQKDVAFGRSDPDADPCGYRTVLMMRLAEKFYDKIDLAEQILAKDRIYIRSKEVDLLALLEAGHLDYIFIYRSIAVQHGLEYLVLPDEINLKNPAFADFYNTASVQLSGKEPGTFVTRIGAPIIYGVTIPSNAPNRDHALAFITYLLDADKGGAILETNGQMSVVPSPTDTFDKIPENLKPFALPVER
ncbi:MAG: tungstate ABC transporter substrate-binding protein WtpA [Planctomycetota bacterium]|nr:MAG: tungstate ABC transporter substrate-binding protein WtpA [Planctomycetota bacterium]